jgi:hypothetical protein
MWLVRYALVCSLLITFNAQAQINDLPIPDQLKTWVPWVLRDKPDHSCPRIAQQPGTRQCLWPGLLKVDITDKKAHFAQTWQVFSKSWVVLPGSVQHWPNEVLIDNKIAVVLDRNGRPSVQLNPGRHLVKGSFYWSSPPQYLPVAAQTALIQLSRNGEKVTAQIDEQGRLWLRDQRILNPIGEKNNTLKVEVFRLLSDDIPMQLTSEIRLAVAGKPRELVLGQLLPDNAEAMDFNSPLPARIEPDGRLRIQARAGEWRLKLKARFLEPTTHFAIRKMDAFWPDQEVWSFRANPQLRGVKITGAPAVDPSQIDIPPGFGGLPTYLMSDKVSLVLKEQYRGDASPAANRLSLNRTLWLDFDGGGATTKDRINGTFSHGWRLRSTPDLQLGRIVTNGTPQLVTQLPGEEGTGIEIRHSQVSVEAINRIEPLTAIAATGWRHDFDSVKLKLNLPPGWQLWHAAGPDRIQSSWLSSWDLWDLFICLLIVGGLFRVLDWRWGLIGALTLALTYHETGAPLIGWVVLVAALPLLTALPAGRLKQLVNTAAHLTLMALIVVVISFTVAQVRKGIYPQLEQYGAINAGPYNYTQSRTPASEMAKQEELDAVGDRSNQILKQSKLMGGAANEPKLKRYRPTDNIQTGPGEPSWKWRNITLGWSGPVKADTPLTLYLSPPWLTRSLKFFQALLVVLLLYGLGSKLLSHHWLFSSKQDKPGSGGSPASITSSVLPLLFIFATATLVTVTPSAQAEQFPPTELLEELKSTLTKAPECAPQCAAVQQTHISLIDEQLLLRQRANVAVELAFPLPTDFRWQPSSVLVDGKSSTLSLARGKLWIHLLAGSHDIILSTTVNGDNVALQFPLTAHNTTVNAPGWQVHGLAGQRVTGGTLQLEKKVKEVAQDTLLAAPIEPLVQVNRQLNADLDWQLVTTITRMAPVTGAINLRIPLLPDESVVSNLVSENVVIENQHAVVTLNARQRQVRWRSVIKPSEKLVLNASDNTSWVEHWQVLASPRWHIRGEGIPSIKTGSERGPMIQLWRPWPGESLNLFAVQPQSVPGPTTTVESIEIDHRPGVRSASLKLTMSLRTSLGGDYRIPQPPAAELQSIVIDGVEQTTPGENEYVVIPLHPGLQNVVISWELDGGVAQTTITPAFKLSTPANNIDIKLQLPRDRWPIFLNGPSIGPAMLYWGVLTVILIIAVILGMIVKRLSLSVPVNTLQWLLLALGMSTVNMAGSIPVVLWFFAMEARRRQFVPETSRAFNISQIALIVLSVVALLSLFYTIPQSLLSEPNMQVTGNGSSNYFYQWYQDHSSDSLPQAWVFSVPLGVFRIAMLAWSLWIVFALMDWIKWGWQCLSTGQLWNSSTPDRARRVFGKKSENKSPTENPDDATKQG